jgi:hypothetical protein
LFFEFFEKWTTSRHNTLRNHLEICHPVQLLKDQCLGADDSVSLSLDPVDPLEHAGSASTININDSNNYVRLLSTGQLQCLLCFHQSTSRSSAKNHLKSHVSCDRCGRNWAGKHAIYAKQSHQKTCKGPKQTICHFCGTSKHGPRRLNEHVKHCRLRLKLDKPTTKAKREYICQFCSKKFVNRSADLKRHLVTCIQNPDNTWRCSKKTTSKTESNNIFIKEEIEIENVKFL